jgi:GAF domain-containing protein
MQGAPIVYGEELMGVFSLFHREPAAFSPDQLELFQAICHQVGVALSNVGRYEQVQHLVEMLEVDSQVKFSLCLESVIVKPSYRDWDLIRSQN